MFGLKAIPKERGTQVYFQDDGSFQIRKLDIEDSFLVEKNSHGKITKAWAMYFKLLKRFPGYRSIGADMVTLSYGRDIAYDPFQELDDKEKPTENGKFKKEFVRRVAESKCYRHEQEAKTSLVIDKVTLFLGVLAIILGLALGGVAFY